MFTLKLDVKIVMFQPKPNVICVCVLLFNNSICLLDYVSCGRIILEWCCKFWKLGIQPDYSCILTFSSFFIFNGDEKPTLEFYSA